MREGVFPQRSGFGRGNAYKEQETGKLGQSRSCERVGACEGGCDVHEHVAHDRVGEDFCRGDALAAGNTLKSQARSNFGRSCVRERDIQLGAGGAGGENARGICGGKLVCGGDFFLKHKKRAVVARFLFVFAFGR